MPTKNYIADDIVTEYTEEARVSETRIDVREELFEGENDEYLDNEMLEPCISEEEISEMTAKGRRINCHVMHGIAVLARRVNIQDLV